MRKRLFALVTILTLVCSLVPSVAFSDEGGDSGALIAVEIEIGADGTPVAAWGEGWRYDAGAGRLTLDAGHAFSLTGAAYTGSTYNNGAIVGGEFSGSVYNSKAIEGGTFDDYVYNYEGSIVSGGVFNGGNNSVTNYGTIRGGEFNISVDSSGSIEDGTFNGGAQNYAGGTISGGTFGGMMFFNSGIIIDGVFDSDTTYNFGEIRNGTFGKAVESDGGTISGGTFASTGSVLSYYGGVIAGGTFNGPVSNCDSDFDPEYNRATITSGTFTGAVANHDTIEDGTFLGNVTNAGAIEGGFFALPVIEQGGTTNACVYPVSATLTGLSIAEAEDAKLVATYEKDSDESNRLTLVADEGYALPDAISVRCGTADGPQLVASVDYAYDAASGAIAIKKGSVAGPLFVVASGVVADDPPIPPDPTPSTSDPAPAPLPDPSPTGAAAPAVPSSATALAATGDGALPQAALGIALLSGGALALCVANRRKRSRR